LREKVSFGKGIGRSDGAVVSRKAVRSAAESWMGDVGGVTVRKRESRRESSEK